METLSNDILKNFTANHIIKGIKVFEARDLVKDEKTVLQDDVLHKIIDKVRDRVLNSSDDKLNKCLAIAMNELNPPPGMKKPFEMSRELLRHFIRAQMEVPVVASSLINDKLDAAPKRTQKTRLGDGMFVSDTMEDMANGDTKRKLQKMFDDVSSCFLPK